LYKKTHIGHAAPQNKILMPQQLGAQLDFSIFSFGHFFSGNHFSSSPPPLRFLKQNPFEATLGFVCLFDAWKTFKQNISPKWG